MKKATLDSPAEKKSQLFDTPSIISKDYLMNVERLLKLIEAGKIRVKV
mgnify:CR=1 FL=1